MAGSSEEGSELPCFDVSVLEKGSTISYTVPNFPVFAVTYVAATVSIAPMGGQPRQNIYSYLMAA